MKIKNNPAKRQENIIKYLSEHGEVATKEILDTFKIPKSSFSEDIKFLKSKGYPIVTRRGYISLEKQETDADIIYHEKLNASIIRKWLILYNLICLYVSCGENYDHLLSYKSLYKHCENIYTMLFDVNGSDCLDAESRNEFSEHFYHSFRKDVLELIDGDYIYSEDICFSWEDCSKRYLSPFSPDGLGCFGSFYVPSKDLFCMVNIDKNEAFHLYNFLEDNVATALFKDLKDLLKSRWPDINDSCISIKEKYCCVPFIARAERDMLECFKMLSYKKKCLDITCRSEENANDSIVYKDFETVGIICSADISHLFLSGRTIGDKQELLLPFEHIIKVQESTAPNTIYDDKAILEAHKSAIRNISPDKQKWKNRYEEVFRAEYGENINECLSAIN